MRVLCFIDNMGPGGAQRQLANLGIGLARRGHDVSFLVYQAADFYYPLLEKNNIKIYLIDPSAGKTARIFKCQHFIRGNGFDAVISFMQIPSLIAEISAFPCKKWKLVVGERSASPNILRTFKGRALRLMHVFSDCVVSNSYANQDIVKRVNPFLSDRKNQTVYNMYDLEELSPDSFPKEPNLDGKFHLVVAASHQYLKNFKNLALAIALLKQASREKLIVDWYGSQESQCYEESVQLMDRLQLKDVIRFYPPTLDIYQKMANADAIGLFSFLEGLSNTICEAMCLGKPVIATDISDNGLLLDDRHLLSDPNSPESISKTLNYLLGLSPEDLSLIGRRNRKKAEKLFGENKIVDQYLSLIDGR